MPPGQPRRAGPGGEVWQNVAHWEGNGKPLHYSYLENPMNNMKRQNDRTLKEELPRSVGAQYATGDHWRKNSRNNEGMEPKQKQYPVVDVTGDRSKVRCCKSNIALVQFSHSVVSNSLQPHESQHARPPCLSPTPRVHPNSCPLSQWCHSAISSSVLPFSSCPQSFPASGSFQMSQ